MTSYVFNPPLNAPFQFTPTLDGTEYIAIITWNVYGQRYYLNLYTQQGALVLNAVIVASPDNYDINLVTGIFTESTLVFRQSSNSFVVTP